MLPQVNDAWQRVFRGGDMEQKEDKYSVINILKHRLDAIRRHMIGE